MECQKVADQRLSEDKVDVLYGEADVEARARVAAHLAVCAACREEMGALARVRQDLAAWQLPRPRPAYTPRGIVLPRWLAAAAALLLAALLGLGASGYVSLRHALAAQQARATALEQGQRRAEAALAVALAQPRPAAADEAALVSLVDTLVAAHVRASERRQAHSLDQRLASFGERVDTRRRVDLARVAAGLSYLDGRHGEQLARTNELMGYMLQTASTTPKR